MVAGNRPSSLGLPPGQPLDHRHGGRLSSTTGELSIHGMGDDYTVEGNGTIKSFPTMPVGATAFLKILGTPTFTNSTKLICQGGVDYIAAAGDLIVARSDGDGVWRIYVLASGQTPSAPQGRLTPTSGTPMPTVSVAGATRLYYTADIGKNVWLYNGAAWALYRLSAAGTAGASEIFIDLGSNQAANTNYDCWLISNAGVLTLGTASWVPGAVGGSDTARGTGAGSTEIQQFDGLWTNKNSLAVRINNTTQITVPANQALLVGTIRIGAVGGQANWILGAASSGGTAGFLGIANLYNWELISTAVIDNGSFYTYTSATVRQARASAGNQISFIVCLGPGSLSCALSAESSTIASGASTTFGLGFDSTTTYGAQTAGVNTPSGSTGMRVRSSCISPWNPGLGWHVLSANENSDSSNANNFCNGNTNTLSLSGKF